MFSKQDDAVIIVRAILAKLSQLQLHSQDQTEKLQNNVRKLQEKINIAAEKSKLLDDNEMSDSEELQNDSDSDFQEENFGVLNVVDELSSLMDSLAL
jgi:uncharacterized protein YlxW (UPF0749 family)